MIVVFPMLTSKSVSNAVIPGICKTLEKFVLVYKMDEILSITGMVGAAITAVQYSKSVLTSSLDLTEAGTKPGFEKDPEYEREERERRRRKDASDAAKAALDYEKEKRQEKERAMKDLSGEFKVDLDFPKQQSLNIEPTWVHLTTKSRSVIVGIKVIAFPVDTDQDIIRIMSTDISLKFFERKLYQYTRSMTRLFWNVARHFKVPFIGADRPVSEDPEDSILFAKTQHGINVFTLLNHADIVDSRVYMHTGAVTRLFKMGWSSFIIADEVNKRATFCMKEFKGMCSTVPYGFLYASINKDVSKVYDNLDDIKKSASPFFRIATSKSKVFGEMLATEKLEKYFLELGR